MDNEWAHDLMLDTLPKLVDKYGTVAAAAASEWYEQIRSEHVDAPFEAVPADNYPMDKIHTATGTQISQALDRADPDQFERWAVGALDRWIRYASRETIVNNTIRDPSQPRWARVPSGQATCAFCLVLASQGFYYVTRKSAIKASTGLRAGKKYHDHCDCQPVPVWEAKDIIIKGYDPDTLYDLYSTARDKLAAGDLDEATLKALRDHDIPLNEYDPNALALVLRRMGSPLVTDSL